MPEAHASRRERRSAERRRIYRRWWFWVALGVLVLAIPTAWVGIRGLMAKGELESAQALISELKAKALAFDTAGASADLERIEEHTETAVELTSDPVWLVAESVPVLGKNLTVVRELAAVSDVIMKEVATPLLDVAAGLTPEALAPKDGAIDLAPLIDVIPVLVDANAATKAAVSKVHSIDAEGTIGQVAAAKDKVAGLLSSIAPLLDTANTLVPLLPPALGSEGLRTYVVMFQNNAEPRALGGTALSFAVVTVDNGAISLVETIPAGFKNFPVYNPPLVTFPPGVQNIFQDSVLGSFIANVTTRPSFTGAAAVTRDMWNRNFGYTPDAIVSVDPVFLSYVLRAVDPITISTGDVLTSDTLVPLLLNELYQRFNTADVVKDNIAQDAVYSEIVGATFTALTRGSTRPVDLLGAIMQGWSENRLLIASAHENEQAALATLGLRGELPVSDDATDRVGVYFQDFVGSKLGFYLSQSVTLSQNSCRDDGRQSYRVTVDLKYDLDPSFVPSLSDSIVGTWRERLLPRGTQRLIVMLYAPIGSTFVGTSIDAQPVPLSEHYDSERPVDLHVVQLSGGQTTTFSYDLIAPVGDRTLAAQVTPMVKPTTVTTVPLDCATVPAD
jgi:hypothetical protein